MFYEQFESNRDYQIRKNALELLSQLKIDTSNAIDISKVTTKMKENIIYEFVDLDGLPGFTCYHPIKVKYKIFLDEDTAAKCLERIIFTIAHEIGHIVLKHFGEQNNSTNITNRKLEYEANIFADELLMPTDSIIKKRMTSEEISKIYLVSNSAAEYKIKYIQRNTIYRENKQTFSKVFSILDRYSDLFKTSDTTYDDNDMIINDYLGKWLEPDYEYEYEFRS